MSGLEKVSKILSKRLADSMQNTTGAPQTVTSKPSKVSYLLSTSRSRDVHFSARRLSGLPYATPSVGPGPPRVAGLPEAGARGSGHSHGGRGSAGGEDRRHLDLAPGEVLWSVVLFETGLVRFPLQAQRSPSSRRKATEERKARQQRQQVWWWQ